MHQLYLQKPALLRHCPKFGLQAAFRPAIACSHKRRKIHAQASAGSSVSKARSNVEKGLELFKSKKYEVTIHQTLQRFHNAHRYADVKRYTAETAYRNLIYSVELHLLVPGTEKEVLILGV